MVHILYEPHDRSRLRSQRVRTASIPMDPRRGPSSCELEDLVRTRDHPPVHVILPPYTTP